VEALSFRSAKVFPEEGETLDLEHPMKNCNHKIEWLH
jgi:hypothetical protein